MKNWLADLCSTTFMPHGSCYLWQPEMVSLHVISDTLIALAYYSIPFILFHFVRRRSDLPYPKIFLMFAAFIVACGTTHVLEVITIWQPVYWLSGGVKLITAAISLATVIALIRIVPAALQLPSPADLKLLNSALEERVKTRTADLTLLNESLRREATQRESAEAEVRRLNAELQRRYAELQTLFNLMPVGVCIASDTACSDQRFNAAYAQMHGLPVAAANVSFSNPPIPLPSNLRLSRNGRELLPSEYPMPAAIATNTPLLDCEHSITRPDGTTIEVLANAIPVPDDAGEPRGCVATFQDITAHKQAERRRLDFERQLLHSQKLESIGVLAGGIAHDFNNLLTGILGHTNLARSNLATRAAEIDPLLEQVESSAQRAAELCRQLLAYAGKGRLIVRLIDLNVAVQQSTALLKLSISKKVTLKLDLASGLPPFRGDNTQLNQILMNLVINASEAIGEKVGTVTLRTARATLSPMDMLTLTSATPDLAPGVYVSLAVADDGCGIGPETIAHIFEPFFTTKFVGRGLGLAAVLGIMQGHGGGIRVSSQPGTGTTFELFFPAQAAAVPIATPNAKTPARTPLPAAAARGTVLVVDDEETVRAFATDALRFAGFTVMTAADGAEAIEQLRRNATRFDAVLLDLTMPKMDGEDTLMALRMLAPDLPVVLTSGYHEQTAVQRFLDRGLAKFLPKPFVTETLVAAMTQAIAPQVPRA